MADKSARLMTDDELSTERKKLETQWDELQKDLEESGGMSGSPGEWIVERLDEINSERTRRVISLDGDIGRRNPRS